MSARRYFSSNIRRQQFLPFEEAREFARSLKIKSYKDWLEYAKLKRAQGLPYHPDRVYADKWVDFKDFLDFPPLPVPSWKEPMVMSRPHSEAFTVKQDTHHKNLDWFANLVSVTAPEFELRRDLGNSVVKFLCRRRDSTHDDRWIPFMFKAANRADYKGSLRFNCATLKQPTTPKFLGRVYVYKEVIYMIPPDCSVPTALTISPSGKYEKYRVNQSEISTVLNSWWENAPKISRRDVQGRYKINSLLKQVEHLCYDPTNVQVHGGCGPASEWKYDSIINGKKILHRRACRLKKQGARGFQVGLERRLDSTFTCINMDDDEEADFYAILVPDDNNILSKMMFFPRCILSELLSDRDNDMRKRQHIIYPSTVKPGQKGARIKQEKQLKYEIDLSQPLVDGPEKERFLQILEGRQ